MKRYIIYSVIAVISAIWFYISYWQVSGDYQRLAYIINDYQGVHFERLSF